jgi:hypothetical protein
VPQNFAEAYFWLDLAATGKMDIFKSGDIPTLRDHAGSLLSSAALLQVQERAQKWFEAHPAPQSAVVDAPPQPSTTPNISSRRTATDALNDAIRDSARGPGHDDNRNEVPTAKGANAAGGVDVLSDTQGVDFTPWLERMHGEILHNWLPLLPSETEPPLMKRGETFIIVTILPDGTVGDMKLDGSTHDQEIDKAAWDSILSEGQFQALPKEFHGPNLILRFHYVVN